MVDVGSTGKKVNSSTALSDNNLERYEQKELRRLAFESMTARAPLSTPYFPASV